MQKDNISINHAEGFTWNM